MSEKKRYKVTNISGLSQPPYGRILDYKGTVIGNGKYAIITVDGLDEKLEQWVENKLVKIQDAQSGEVIGAHPQTVITAGTRVEEITGYAMDELGDEDELNFDTANAQEAILPVTRASAPIAGDLSQDSKHHPRVKISVGSENERTHPDDMSPIPGERVRPVDEAHAFTIRAPKAPI